jgi:hypothetical protein
VAVSPLCLGASSTSPSISAMARSCQSLIPASSTLVDDGARSWRRGIV